MRDAIELQAGRCLDHGGLAGRATVWLGRDRIDQRVRVRVVETPSRGVDITVLREGAPVAERHLKPATIPCADLQAAVGLAVALAIDATFLQELMSEPTTVLAPPVIATSPPAQASAPIQSQPSAQTPSLPLAQAAQPQPSPPPLASGPDNRASLAGKAAIHGWVGVVPSTTLGGSFGVDLGWPSAALQLSGWGTIGRESQLGAGRVDVSMLAGRLDGCGRKPMGRWTGIGCVGAIAGRWVARGGDYRENYAPALPWAAVAVRVATQWEVGRFVAIEVAVDGFFPFARPRLDVVGTDGAVATSLQAPAAGFGIGVGPVLTFF
ncbi:MAG: hypothetical protein HY898_15735 [Deltaproteobacteria bacterium]|nr:hypothetical protein [Deltaproteobacteria bacterium]